MTLLAFLAVVNPRKIQRIECQQCGASLTATGFLRATVSAPFVIVPVAVLYGLWAGAHDWSRWQTLWIAILAFLLILVPLEIYAWRCGRYEVPKSRRRDD